MNALEAVCVAIVAFWIAVRGHGEPVAFYGRLAALAGASLIGEATCVRAYGFYGYSADWSLYVDVVPLLVVLIWPVVIHSAWDLARRLGARNVALAAGGLVLADAALIEPIAVQAGLWHWTEPGLFTVPPIGILGWAIHGALCAWALERGRPLAALLAPIALHGLLLATWWGALRWVNWTVPEWPAVAAAAAVSGAVTWAAVRTKAGRRVPRSELLARVPAAVFFFALLAMHGRDVAPLVAWAVAFAPPYVALTAWAVWYPSRS